MAYSLQFLESALKEWSKLGPVVKSQFIKALEKRLENPRIPSAALRNMPDCYKIKLRDAGYRLVYRVDDGVVSVIVIAVGKRDRNQAYSAAASRIKDENDS